MLGMDLKWDYDNRHVDISMSKYVQKALKKFNHPQPAKHQDQPHAWLPPTYGQKVQFSPTSDTSNPLSPTETK